MVLSESAKLQELLPLLVDILLDLLDDRGPPLILEVLEPALGIEPVGDRLLLRLSVGDPQTVCGQGVLPVDDLVQRPDAAIDRQLGYGDGVAGSEPPSPGTGGNGIDEGRWTRS